MAVWVDFSVPANLVISERDFALDLLGKIRTRLEGAGVRCDVATMPKGAHGFMRCFTTSGTIITTGVYWFDASDDGSLLTSSIACRESPIASWMRWMRRDHPRARVNLLQVSIAIKEILDADPRLTDIQWCLVDKGRRPLPDDWWSGAALRRRLRTHAER